MLPKLNVRTLYLYLNACMILIIVFNKKESIMKKLALAIASAAILAGCSTAPKVNAPKPAPKAPTTSANTPATHDQLVKDAKAHHSHVHYHCASQGSEPIKGSVNTAPHGQNGIELITSLPDLNLQPTHFALTQVPAASGNLYQGRLPDGRVIEWHVKGQEALLSSKFENVSFDLACHVHHHAHTH